MFNVKGKLFILLVYLFIFFCFIFFLTCKSLEIVIFAFFYIYFFSLFHAFYKNLLFISKEKFKTIMIKFKDLHFFKLINLNILCFFLFFFCYYSWCLQNFQSISFSSFFFIIKVNFFHLLLVCVSARVHVYFMFFFVFLILGHFLY